MTKKYDAQSLLEGILVMGLLYKNVAYKDAKDQPRLFQILPPTHLKGQRIIITEPILYMDKVRYLVDNRSIADSYTDVLPIETENGDLSTLHPVWEFEDDSTVSMVKNHLITNGFCEAELLNGTNQFRV